MTFAQYAPQKGDRGTEGADANPEAEPDPDRQQIKGSKTPRHCSFRGGLGQTRDSSDLEGEWED